jgi:hypothetical protein
MMSYAPPPFGIETLLTNRTFCMDGTCRGGPAVAGVSAPFPGWLQKTCEPPRTSTGSRPATTLN